MLSKIKYAHRCKLCVLLIVFLTQAVKKKSEKKHFFPQADKKLRITGESFEMLSLSECIPWMTLGLAESVVIVTLNLCTIIVFIRNRNLRKRSMYLVINLAVMDMFGAGHNVYRVFYIPGINCNLWKWHSIEYVTHSFIWVLMALFSVASLTNIAIIALERVHATFFPFRHRVIKKWVHGLIIAAVWVTSGLVLIASAVLEQFEETSFYGICSLVTFCLICLLIICVSYTSIVITVRCAAQPQHHGATSRERKLTMTLLIVTVVSLLLYLPNVILGYVAYISKFELFQSFSVTYHLGRALLFLYFANSLVNPILYAMRMPEYRSALLALFRKLPQQQRQVAVFPLRDM